MRMLMISLRLVLSTLCILKEHLAIICGDICMYTCIIHILLYINDTIYDLLHRVKTRQLKTLLIDDLAAESGG